MRSAIFFGTIMIAKAIDNDIAHNHANFLAGLIVVFMIADLMELIKKLTK